MTVRELAAEVLQLIAELLRLLKSIEVDLWNLVPDIAESSTTSLTPGGKLAKPGGRQ